MYILITIFAVYAMGIIAYEHGFFGYLFTAIFVLLIFNSIVNKRYLYNTVLISFLILSFINCKYNSKYVLTQYIYSDAEFEAKIRTKNKTNPDSLYESYNAEITAVNNKKLQTKENTIIYFNKDIEVKENSIVSFKGSVAGSSFSKNKMLFNYENFLRTKKVGAVIFAKSNINTIKTDYSFLNKVSVRFRNYTESTFYNSLNKRNADIILSIILGDVDYLDEGLYDNIKIMGLAHIFAVSGSHIVLMYGFLLTVLKYCCIRRRISWVITWSLIWFYGFLIGFPISVMRALVMFTLLFGSEVLYRKYNSLNSIGLAALVLTLYNPFWLFDAGFLLSFSAALSMIIYNKYIVNHLLTKNGALRSLYMNLFLQLFTLPVVSYYFNFMPVMGIIYNILLLPVFTVIIIYGFMLLMLNGVAPVILSIPFKIFNYILYSLRYIIDFTDNLIFKGITMPSMSISMIIFFYTMVFFMIYLYNNKTFIVKRYGLIALISFCSLNFVILPSVDSSLYFNVVDAGQGLFTMAKYKNTCMIFDCGSTSSKNFGEYTVVPYLTKHGIRNISKIFISHWDYDHYSGLEDLFNSNVQVKKILAPRHNEEIMREKEILCKGNNLKIENLKINILWPDKKYDEDNINNSSLVIKLQYYNKSILLTGDIEESVENMLVDIGHSDVLIVPHHGSKTSSTDNFVQRVKPDIAVMSYGKNNYGIPSDEVIYRYEKAGSVVLSTFNEGEINFILKNDKIYYNTYTNEKSGNYYELYLEGILNNSTNFCLLLYCIIKDGKCYELQNYNRYD